MSVSIPPRILLLGGHGKVALFMTPRLLSRGWSLTSVIRDPAQTTDIEHAAAKAQGSKGKLDVLVHSLEDVSSEFDARQVIEKVKPNWIIWSAGAGGKGGPTRTHAIDNIAACAFARAAASTPSVTAFLMVSAINSRRRRPAWWTDSDWESIETANKGVFQTYSKAKIAADECLTSVAYQRNSVQDAVPFSAVVLRPGSLTDSEATGKVHLGKTAGMGSISRADVADVAVSLLEEVQKGWTGGWVDLLSGQDDVEDAVRKWISSGEDTIEGEDVEEIRKAESQ